MSEQANERVVEEAAEQLPENPPSKKKKGKKKWVIGAIVVVIVAVGVGMWIWHNDPSFCNNPVCHNTMDPYVQTLYQQDGEKGVDKWGNEVSNSHAMLAVTHASNDLACLDCHVPSLGQQVGEVMTQLSGNYSLPLKEVDLIGLMTNSNHVSDTGRGDEFCLQPGCHDVTRQELTALTANLAFNPHSWQHKMNTCSECHKSHRASTITCTDCHVAAKNILPAGWVDSATAKRYEKAIAS